MTRCSPPVYTFVQMEGLAAKLPLFSIISMSMGRLQHVKECVDSWLVQRDSEVIVVDYSCPDHAGDWLEANRPQVRVIRVPGRDEFNVAEIRNIGERAARGEWIISCDGDIELASFFAIVIREKLSPGIFMIPDSRNNGLGGFAVVSKADSLAHPWDEEFAGQFGYGMVDVDRNLVLYEAGLVPTRFPSRWLKHHDHEDSLRTAHHKEKDKHVATSRGGVYLARKHGASWWSEFEKAWSGRWGVEMKDRRYKNLVGIERRRGSP